MQGWSDGNGASAVLSLCALCLFCDGLCSGSSDPLLPSAIHCFLSVCRFVVGIAANESGIDGTAV